MTEPTFKSDSKSSFKSNFKSGALSEILRAELKAGNAIVEASDWPPNCDTFILLKYRFGRAYWEEGAAFKEINDPHYWFAEYNSADGRECLACRADSLAVRREKRQRNIRSGCVYIVVVAIILLVWLIYLIFTTPLNLAK